MTNQEDNKSRKIVIDLDQIATWVKEKFTKASAYLGAAGADTATVKRRAWLCLLAVGALVFFLVNRLVGIVDHSETAEKNLSLWAMWEFIPIAGVVVLVIFGGMMVKSIKFQRLEPISWRWFRNRVTSVIAGELGYRWLFIPAGMMAIYLTTVALGACTAIPLGAILLIFGGYKSSQMKADKHLAVAFMFMGGLLLVSGLAPGDPVYWLFGNIIVPALNILTLGTNTEVTQGDYSKMAIFGAILVNTFFRDTNKYRGWYGFLAAAIVGWSMIAIAEEHGVWSVLGARAIYELEHESITRLIARVLKVPALPPVIGQ